MGNPVQHAASSVQKFGGVIEDYLPIHCWFDDSKSAYADFRHRALRHHSLGIFWAEETFGEYIVNADGAYIPVRVIGEQHVREDFGGFIPTVQDWLSGIIKQPWMQPPPDYIKRMGERIAPHMRLPVQHPQHPEPEKEKLT